MSITPLNTDYLVVGSGAVGMAFADTILTETDADIVMVDKHHQPGGHWNDAYPFVTLHQPSAFYGVSSRELSRGQIDQVGWNKGMQDLATGAEVSAYFNAVMHEQFLPTGRVRYFPSCDYTGDGQFHSILSGKRYSVEASNKTVDATFLKASVPSTHTPSFSIDPEVSFIAVNELPKINATPAGYVIIGGGKTGIDACLWLLENQVDPDRIHWIMPRDAWLIDRKNTQPGEAFFNDSMGTQAAQMEAIAAAQSPEDMFHRLEAAGVFLRIDPTVEPEMFHAATVSQLELEQLQRVKNIVRLGRVTELQRNQIVLEQGNIPTSREHLHIDCSASAIPPREPKPVFEGNLITPQTVRAYQPAFSAAFIAHVESKYDDEATKNELCAVVPLPNSTDDWMKLTAAFMANQYRWSQEPGLREWLLGNRLDGFSKTAASATPEHPERMAIMDRLRENAFPAMAKLQQFIAELD